MIYIVRLNPYISFKDNTREAIEFYKSVFGGELTISTFKDGGMPVEVQEADLIMHAMLVVDEQLVLMASDTPTHMDYKPTQGISISLSGEASDDEKLRGYWNKLIEGGNAYMPLDKAPWGDTFGMLTDKFGINWMVNIAGEKA